MDNHGQEGWHGFFGGNADAAEVGFRICHPAWGRQSGRFFPTPSYPECTAGIMYC
jgi:hypothetical protein